MTPLSRYSQTQKETASKERLMVMLFERALKDMRVGADALQGGRRIDAVTALTHASDIVAELHNTLDKSRAPELCGHLEDIYRFVMLRLTDASLKQDPHLVKEAERAFAPLVEAFSTAVASLGSSPNKGSR
jgi:flagellar protein FliS